MWHFKKKIKNVVFFSDIHPENMFIDLDYMALDSIILKTRGATDREIEELRKELIKFADLLLENLEWNSKTLEI